MSKSYSFEKKEKLFDKVTKLVEKLASRKDIVQIKKIKNIIDENNPDVSKMKNSNGCFMDFENLTDKTYDELSHFVVKHEKRLLKEIESELLETPDVLSDNEILSDESENISKKLRLTNTENHILNRVKYEEELKKNEENAKIDSSSSTHKPTNSNINDIFIKAENKKGKAKSKK